MSIRKRNEFLDADDSEDEAGLDYDLEEQEGGRGGIGGRSKRRKVEPELDTGSNEALSGESDDNEGEEYGTTTKRESNALASDDTAVNSGRAEVENGGEAEAQPFTRTSKIPTPKEVTRAQKAARKSGVVYISRVPPFMKPHTLRHFLSFHAPRGIGRIFLTPEDHDSQLRRRKSGGNKKKSFTDGWIEFHSKTEAKEAAEFLNGHIIGGKKGNFYHDDLWNLKYLKGFKWSHLTEQIANENAERAARMREEIRRTRKENEDFLKQIEAGKIAETTAEREARRVKRGALPSTANYTMSERDYKQKRAQTTELAASANKNTKTDAVLRSIF